MSEMQKSEELAELKRREAENSRILEEQTKRSAPKAKESSEYMKKMSDEEFEEYVKQKRAEREFVPDDIENVYFDIPSSLKDPRFVYYIANDRQGRIQQLEARGWTKVIDPKIAQSKSLAEDQPIRFPNGTGVSFLMRIPKELYQENMKKLDKKNDEIEHMIRENDKNLDKNIQSSKSFSKIMPTDEEY